jgi:glucose-1-phosphate cytidylyltransferase
MSVGIPVVILCGGRGLRMSGLGETVPKPLTEIGGRPILWHVMSLYAAQGFDSFVLCLGYEGEKVKETITALDGVQVVSSPQEGGGEGWRVVFADTGLETPTGGRVAQIGDLVRPGTFCLTYADGLADIDLDQLVEYHVSQRRAATMTVVRPRNPWGVAQLGGDGVVRGFEEKPRLNSWINGGFLVMEPRALDHIGPDDVLEGDSLPSLAAAGELGAYRHEGFWECMDTYKDALHLNDLWERGQAPWTDPAPVPRSAP